IARRMLNTVAPTFCRWKSPRFACSLTVSIIPNAFGSVKGFFCASQLPALARTQEIIRGRPQKCQIYFALCTKFRRRFYNTLWCSGLPGFSCPRSRQFQATWARKKAELCCVATRCEIEEGQEMPPRLGSTSPLAAEKEPKELFPAEERSRADRRARD